RPAAGLLGELRRRGRRAAGEQAHLGLELVEGVVLRAGAAGLEGEELRLERAARDLAGELGAGLGLGLEQVDVIGHAVERVERAGVAEPLHRAGDLPLRLGALLPRDEDVLLPL